MNTHVVPLNEEDAARVTEVRMQIGQATQALGALREGYLAQEAQLMSNIQQLRARADTILSVFSQSYVGGDTQAGFDHDRNAFVIVRPDQENKINDTDNDLKQSV